MFVIVARSKWIVVNSKNQLSKAFTVVRQKVRQKRGWKMKVDKERDNEGWWKAIERKHWPEYCQGIVLLRFRNNRQADLMGYEVPISK